MRKKHRRFNVGETRIVTKFLFFPKTINYETRWLEFASWVERCVLSNASDFPYNGLWAEVEWHEN